MAAVIAERGVLTASDEAWELAVGQAAVIGPLAAQPRVGSALVDQAAAELGISRRQVYVLLRRWRAGEGVVSDLLPGSSDGGRGGSRLPAEVEATIQRVLESGYLNRQRRSVASVHREISRACVACGHVPPSRGAVERRIAKLDPVRSVAAREGRDAARALTSAGGQAPEVSGLLQQVQIDHTPVDVIVVDERDRMPIGRPYLTVAIDVAARCVVGLVVTLEAPSATSVGLVLAHAVTDKRAWLERLGVQAAWSMSGKPAELYVDNATEFKSEALRRGCLQHAIELRYRPPGQPHYGGIVERLIGTLMKMVHELPGTTFSNTGERAGYDSDKAATLTLEELQRWLALAVAVYHGRVHETLGRTPAAVWAEKVSQGTQLITVTDETAFLIDFLPVIRRTLSRSGFVVDRVHYYCDALRPWIARRDQLSRFVLRRDPRDISRVWVLDPDCSAYLEVPYRTMSRPPITAWEQQAATARLRELGRREVDEEALFAMVAQMREISESAAARSRRARRDLQRRPEPRPPSKVASLAPPPDTPPTADRVQPFEVIEQW